MTRRLVPPVLTVVFLVTWLPFLHAQQTREDEIRKQREEKAKALRPYKPGRIEAGLIKLEEGRYLDRLFNPPSGLFPRLGGITSGAGLSVGPGYRAAGLANGQLDLLASASVSHKRYWAIEATATLPRLARGRMFAELRGRKSEYPQEDFFGLGPDSRRDRRTSYALRNTEVGAGIGVRLARWLAVGERVDYLTPEVSAGTDKRFPSIERLFGEGDAPGLVAQPNFLRYQTFVALDYRQPTLNARRGGLYLVSYNRYDDRDLGRYSFARWDVDLQQFISSLKGHRVLVLRAAASLADADGGREVPFYLQPWLGGSHTLRGFRSYRFRDRNTMLLQAEYRWEILPVLMGALFYDAGRVAAERRALDLAGLKRDYGFGLRFGGGRGVFLRTDIAFGGGEGTKFLLRFNNVF